MTEQNVPAGWYPDPQDSAHRRWWDGTRWTEHTDSGPAPAYGERVPAEYAPKPPEPAPAASWQQPGSAAGTAQGHPQQYAPYAGQSAGQAGYGVAEYPQAPAGTKAHTWAVWVMVVLPLLTLVSIFTIDWNGYLQWSIDRSLDPTQASGSALPPQNVLVGLGVSQAIGFVTWVVSIVLAFVDASLLKRRGVVRPFGWGWAALSTFAYFIGRGVVLRRRGVTRGALLPIWISIVVVVVIIIATFSVIGSATAQVIGSVPPGSL